MQWEDLYWSERGKKTSCKICLNEHHCQILFSKCQRVRPQYAAITYSDQYVYTPESLRVSRDDEPRVY